MTRMHLNEPSFEPSPRVLQALADNVALAARYPDATWSALRERLAGRLSVPVDRLLCANGSDELLSLLGVAMLEPGSSIVFPDPSFPRYQQMGKQAGAQTRAIPVRADGACDVDAMLQACADTPRMMVVASPNNPTGQLLDAAELTRVVTETPADTLLVIDEAYFEFGQQAGGPDALQVLQQRTGHWLVLRTFSKAYALAGLRVGYGVASSAEIAGLINKVRNAFNVNALAQVAAIAALDDEGYMHEQVAVCAAQRDRLAMALNDIGMPCLPSAANFLASDAGRPAAEVVAEVAESGICISAVGPTHPNHIRITIGSEADNDRLIEALAQIHKSQAK